MELIDKRYLNMFEENSLSDLKSEVRFSLQNTLSAVAALQSVMLSSYNNDHILLVGAEFYGFGWNGGVCNIPATTPNVSMFMPIIFTGNPVVAIADTRTILFPKVGTVQETIAGLMGNEVIIPPQINTNAVGNIVAIERETEVMLNVIISANKRVNVLFIPLGLTAGIDFMVLCKIYYYNGKLKSQYLHKAIV